MTNPNDSVKKEKFVEIPNPYLTHDIKSGRPLYHKDLIEGIKKVFEAKQPGKVIVIQGYVGSGKTRTLKLMVEDQEILGESYIPVDIDSFEIKAGDISNFFWLVYRAINTGMSTRGIFIDELDYSLSSPILFNEMKIFIEKVEEKLSENNDQIVMLLIFTHFEELMVTIDEVMVVAIVNFFRHLVSERNKFRLIIAGKARIIELAKEKKVADFLKAARRFNVSNILDSSEIENLITQPVKDHLHYKPSAIEEIIKITGGNLYCQQLLCHYLINYLNYKKRDTCSETDVQQAAKNTINDKREDFIYFWNRLDDYESQLVAAALADKNMTKQRGDYYFLEESSLLNVILDKMTIDTTLDRLFKNDYITKIDERRFGDYPFKIPLYGKWVQKEHQFLSVVVENWNIISSRVSLSTLGKILEALPAEKIPLDSERIRIGILFIKTWLEIKSGFKQHRVERNLAERLVHNFCNMLRFNVREKPGLKRASFTINMKALSLIGLEDVLLFVQPIETPIEYDIQEIYDEILRQEKLSNPSFILCFNKSEMIQKLAQKRFLSIVLIEENDLKKLILSPQPLQVFKQEILIRQVKPSALLPYQTDGPVTTTFYGRHDEIGRIRRAKDQNFAIVGPRKIGKTSLLYQVKEKNLLLDTIGIYMNLEAPQDQNYTTFLQNMKEKIQEKRYKKITFNNQLPHLPRFIKEFGQASGKHLVFFLDEIDLLLRFDKKNNYQLLKIFRSLSQEGYCQVILSGFEELFHAAKDLSSPLYNLCELIRLDHFTRNDALALISEPMESIGVRYHNPDDRKLILQHTSCHPNLLQFFAQRLIKKIEEHENENQRRLIFNSDIEEVFESSEYEEYVTNDFYLFDTEDIGVIEKLIVLLLVKDYSINEIITSSEIHAKLKAHNIPLTIGKLNRHLDNLILRYIFKKEGQGKYRFVLPIFPELLKKIENIGGLIAEVKKNAKKSL